MPVRLFVVSNELPFPAIHGGRVDQWSRFLEFKNQGVQLAGASWYSRDEAPTPTQLKALGAVFERLLTFPIDRTPRALLRRLAHLPFRSPHVTTRTLGTRDHARLVAAARQFAPDAVWLDGLYGGVTAQALATELNLPLFYRSHNIEFAYMNGQADKALTVRDKVAWKLAAWHLEAFETKIQQSSKIVFDISTDDLNFWRSRGISHNFWLPTLAGGLNSRPIEFRERVWDIIFLGNLSTPNNVEGLRWFTTKVLPLLRQAVPSIRILIAGSRPTKELRALLVEAQLPLNENPPDANEVLRAGRVLINPVLSGSGVNVKSIEMLNHDAAVVTTSAGVRGIPAFVKREFEVGDTPGEFACCCLNSLKIPFVLTNDRIQARLQFGPDAIQTSLLRMSGHLK